MAGFKRRRRPNICAAAAAAFASLAVVAGDSTGIHEDLGGGDGEDRVMNDEDHHNFPHRHPESLRRRLATSAAEAFASFTPSKVRRALPLDLKIDLDSGRPYVAGLNGHLEPYEETFRRIGDGEDVESEYWDSILEIDAMVEGEDAHWQEAHHHHYHHEVEGDRLYYKVMEADGIEPLGDTNSQWLRGGGRRLDGRAPDDQVALELDSIEFRAASEFDEDVEDDGEEEVDAQEEKSIPEEGRALQGGLHRGSVQSPSRSLPWEDKSSQGAGQFDQSNLRPLRRDRNKNRNKNKNKNNNNKNKNNNGGDDDDGGKNNKKKFNPSIGRLVPSKGDSVQGRQTFGAVVSPSSQTNSPLDKVTFQLTDHTGSASDWLDMPSVGGELYEITINGFEKYPDTRWRYALKAEDKKGRSASTGNVAFKVRAGAGTSGRDFADAVNNAPSPDRAPPAPSPSRPMPKDFASDSDWSHGGSIQKSTGRIMFEFDDSGQTFVCSGTVVCDGPRGETGDTRNGRSVIQTAAHCAYNDVLKKFATRAIFVPDQDSTRGDKSDFDCQNDRYGCWHLSFAVAAEGWTLANFPENVPFDYAYYTVFDDSSTHTGGYTSGLTGILDRDIPCVPIDFDRRLNSEFIFSIGYSADRDPRLRHCAMTNTEINGVPWYTNFWLDDCAMTGGASGGPWMEDLDQEGRGTLVSVNSWGFTHRAGMAGPNLRTSSGSWAECLYEKAKWEDDPGRSGGIIATDC